MLVYLDKLPTGINRAEFEAKVRQICKDRKIINPNWLMIIMFAESNMKLVSNSIGAYGFIQITPGTAKNDLGISIDNLKLLSWQKYMDYASTYIKNRIAEQKGVIPHNAYELYALIHYPASYQKPLNYVLYQSGSTAYNGNKGLDYNKDGQVINAEIRQFIDSKCPLFFDKTTLLKAEDASNYYYQNYRIGEILIAFASSILFIFIMFKIFQKSFKRWTFSV